MRRNGIRSHSLDVDEFALVHRDGQVRIGLHVTVAGKMLADGMHPALLQSHQQAVRQFGDRLRIAVERAVADHAALPVIHVQHRRETEVHAAGAQFRGQHIAGLLRQMARALRMRIPDFAELAHRRNLREALAEALHPPALVVHRDQQRRRAQRVDRGSELCKLAWRLVIAREQDHPADQRMHQSCLVLRSQSRAQHIQHHRPQTHNHSR